MAPVYTYQQNNLSAVRGAQGIEWLSPQEAANRIAAGEASPVTKDEVFRSYYRDDPVAAGMMGLARGATLGLSDVGFAQAFGGEAVKEYEEESPKAALAGELVGMVGSAFIPGGPLAQIGKGAQAAVTATKLAAKAPTVARVARAGLEGAGVVGAYGATRAVWDPDKTAADVLQDVAAGAALGGGFSLAGVGLGRLGRFVSDKVGGRARRALEKQESLQAELSTLRKQYGLVNADLRAELGVHQAPIIEEIASLKQKLATITDQVEKTAAIPAKQRLVAQRDALQKQLDDVKGSLGKAKDSLAREGVELREQLQRRIDALKAELTPVTTGMLGKVSRFVMNRKLAHVVGAPFGGGAVASAVGWSVAPGLTKRLAGGVGGDLAGARKVTKNMTTMLGRSGRRVRLPAYKLTVDSLMQLREELDTTDTAQLRAELYAGLPSEVGEATGKEVVEETIKGLEFLKKALWAPGPRGLGEDPKPTQRQVDVSTAVARAAVDPQSVFEDLNNLSLTDEALSAVEALYPKQLEQMRKRLGALLGARKDYSLQEITQLSLFFRDPTLVTLFASPAMGVYMQDHFNEQAKNKGRRTSRRSIKAHERAATDLERAKEK